MARKPSSAYGEVYVLRLGHRPGRDKRVTTHVALVARAYGANGFILAGECDKGVLESVIRVVRRWGDDFHLSCTESGARFAEEWKKRGGEVIHLTMYGVPVREAVHLIKASSKPKLVVVGAEKVPPEFYSIADYNVSVSTQPHSEVAALATFLDHLFTGKWLYSVFEKAEIIVYPSPRRKNVKSLEPKPQDK